MRNPLLLAPSFIILTSGILSISIDNELVHYLILLAAVPVSIFALYLGYKNHKNLSFLPFGIIGLFTLVSAVLLGEAALGEMGERALTLLGFFISCVLPLSKSSRVQGN